MTHPPGKYVVTVYMKPAGASWEDRFLQIDATYVVRNRPSVATLHVSLPWRAVTVLCPCCARVSLPGVLTLRSHDCCFTRDATSTRPPHPLPLTLLPAPVPCAPLFTFAPFAPLPPALITLPQIASPPAGTTCSRLSQSICCRKRRRWRRKRDLARGNK